MSTRPSNERLDHVGVDHRAALDHLADRASELCRLADPLFEQVRQAARPVPEQCHRVIGVVVLGQHDDPDRGVIRTDGQRRLDPLGGVRRRHPDVGDDRVGPLAVHDLDELDSGGNGGDELHVLGEVESAAYALTHEVVVLGDGNPDRLGHGHHDAPGRTCRTPGKVRLSGGASRSVHREPPGPAAVTLPVGPMPSVGLAGSKWVDNPVLRRTGGCLRGDTCTTRKGQP